jgi:ABC-type multidrug transport system ATPase subunit
VRKKALGGYSGRHAAALRHRPGAARRSQAHHRRRADRRPRPEERTRFHNLLVEIGEEVIVLLSTHIVSDVSDLCPQLAIMNKGKLLASGTPKQLTDALAGRIWEASVNRAEVAPLREQHKVISTRLYTGKTTVHVIADGAPGPDFVPVEATLEDAYFAAIGGHA